MRVFCGGKCMTLVGEGHFRRFFAEHIISISDSKRYKTRLVDVYSHSKNIERTVVSHRCEFLSLLWGEVDEDQQVRRAQLGMRRNEMSSVHVTFENFGMLGCSTGESIDGRAIYASLFKYCILNR